MIKDTSEIKNKIVHFLENNGPSLPVHIAKDVEMDMLFTSAFLSELLSQHRIKTSNMKVGTSPIYFIPGQESKLEKFSEYIKGKEKEAYLLLKQKRFLIENDQEIALKVALSNIKDFAFNFERGGKTIWRFLNVSESEYVSSKKQEKKEIKKEKVSDYTQEIKGFTKQIPLKKRIIKNKKTSERKNEKFFNLIKENLKLKQIEILDIIGFNIKNLTLKVNLKGEEKLIVAFNKKRITEKDILLAFKKAQEQKLNYIIFSLGEPAKKTINFLEATKKLDSIEKIE